ncbi:hypothetical protein Dda_4430 [Drechslerella dactyloides]|uniref:Protein ZIP4 homolog n=1 Tax=Drechslerella dactyloides TaxID=74499 RepID=A0AAD6J137_DREDA|nr:hypothetical protein Dda_4430 [Drechslerella dactyloides]
MEDKLQALGLVKAEKQVKQFLASIDALLTDLKSTHKSDPSTWPPDRLDNLLQAIDKCAKARGQIKAKDDHAALDQRGTELWNLTTKLLRSESPSDVENRKIHLKHHNDVVLAESVLSNAAKYIDDLSKDTAPLSADDEGDKINLECEYLVLRVELSFLQHNLHAAEFMCNNAMERFSRDDGAASKLEPRVREALGKVLYRIGKDVVKRGNAMAGVEWLAKALEVVDAKHLGSDHFAAELRFGIMQNLVQTSLKTQSAEDLQRAKSAMDSMTKHKASDRKHIMPNNGSQALMKMICNVPLSEHSFKVIVGKCHVLLAQDLHGHGYCSKACETLEHQCDPRIADYSLVNSGQWLETIQWCKVALHPIFSGSGELNAGKIARRIIHCAIEAGDSEAAQVAHENMPAVCQETGSTQFLLFKSALRSLDFDMVLYACALEAQSSGNKDIILKVLNQLLERADTAVPLEGVHLPAVFRTMIRLILSDIQDHKAVADEILANLHSVFEKALNNACKSKVSDTAAAANAKPAWSTDEYDWFSRNSYNLALRALQHWPVQYALHFARLCVQFIKLYPAENCSEEEQENLALRQSFCDYICASTCTALARKESGMDEQDELEWIAATLWNLGIDKNWFVFPRNCGSASYTFQNPRFLGADAFLEYGLANLCLRDSAGDYGGSKKWAEFALSVAGFVQDGGQMEALLHAKFANLRTS